MGWRRSGSVIATKPTRMTIEVRGEDLTDLFSILSRLSLKPMGDHLLDSDFMKYIQLASFSSDDQLSSSSKQELESWDAHIVSCVKCARELERLLTAYSTRLSKHSNSPEEAADTTYNSMPARTESADGVTINLSAVRQLNSLIRTARSRSDTGVFGKMQEWIIVNLANNDWNSLSKIECENMAREAILESWWFIIDPTYTIKRVWEGLEGSVSKQTKLAKHRRARSIDIALPEPEVIGSLRDGITLARYWRELGMRCGNWGWQDLPEKAFDHIVRDTIIELWPKLRGDIDEEEVWKEIRAALEKQLNYRLKMQRQVKNLNSSKEFANSSKNLSKLDGLSRENYEKVVEETIIEAWPMFRQSTIPEDVIWKELDKIISKQKMIIHGKRPHLASLLDKEDDGFRPGYLVDLIGSTIQNPFLPLIAQSSSDTPLLELFWKTFKLDFQKGSADTAKIYNRHSILQLYWKRRIVSNEELRVADLDEICRRVAEFGRPKWTFTGDLVMTIKSKGLDPIMIERLTSEEIIVNNNRYIYFKYGIFQDFCMSRWCLEVQDGSDFVTCWKSMDSEQQVNYMRRALDRLLSIKCSEARRGCLGAVIESFLYRRLPSNSDSDGHLNTARSAFCCFLNQYHSIGPLVAQRDLIEILGWFQPCDVLDPGSWSDGARELAQNLPSWFGRVLVESAILYNNTFWEQRNVRWPSNAEWYDRKMVNETVSLLPAWYASNRPV